MKSIQNRNRTFHSIQGDLPKRRKQVYQSIGELGFASLDKICQMLNKTKNEISGRITELKQSYLITEVGTEKSATSNNSVTVYRITTENERVNLINRKYVSLIDKRDSIVNDINLKLSNTSLSILKEQVNKLNAEINNLSKLL